ncbi:MAG: hypothetical protein AAF402_12835 [Pseudomonadota bacterium]
MRTFKAGFVSRNLVQNPTDVIRFKEHWVATEIYNNRLAVFPGLDSDASEVRYIDGPSLGVKFRAPHHLAISPWGSLLVSNGWGSSIVDIADLESNSAREFKGRGKNFRAPHGICVDASGWIYVADSLNSRLVRFRSMDGEGWQVFADHDRKVSYVRQLVCNNEGVWAANTYELKEGLNPGQGSNVLFIRDFESGRAEEVVTIPGDNMSGVQPFSKQVALTLWHGYPNVGIFERADQSRLIRFTDFPVDLGVPYSIYKSPESDRMIVAYFGSLENKGKSNPGGLAEILVE